MGCDIHPVVEVRRENQWKALTWPNPRYGTYSWETDERTVTFEPACDRNYNVFAILADVRNGRGFAGIETGEGFNYIDQPRGRPVDMDPATEQGLSDEHSASYVSLRELLDFDWAQETTHYGVVSAYTFHEWDMDRIHGWNDHVGPSAYVGSITGPNINYVTEEQMRQAIAVEIEGHEPHQWHTILEDNPRLAGLHTQVSLKEYYSESAGHFYTRAIPIMNNSRTGKRVSG